MPGWVSDLLPYLGGGTGLVALAVTHYDRRQERGAKRLEIEEERPAREHALQEQILGAARAIHDDMREEMDRLRGLLIEERSAFQAERSEMLRERAAWAQERQRLIGELEAERQRTAELTGQLVSLKVEADELKDRVGKLEQRLRGLGHDPDGPPTFA